ncbi:hypothetical protein EB796_017952 [Bugula neritina]|uniref:C2H2-type domain-containing protein n=1 Tax=Bugula neritina TaxID=10212 RepID=A0A7J7JBW0_BUGNE|nr:hypothetical protein EB796_017952 [Bugula neritina]
MKTMHPHEPVKVIYPCNQCNFITDQLLLHNLHQDKHTPQGTYTCKLCNKSLTNRIQWVLHKKRCKELQRDAKEPGVSAKSSPVDSQDWKKEHKFFCRHCNSLLTASDEYTEHMAFSHKDEKLRTLYPCSNCSHVTDDDAEYAAHTQCHVTGEKLTCSRCFFICQDEAILLQHQKRCLKEEPDSQEDSSNLDAASMEIDSTESLPEQEKTDAVPSVEVSATQCGSSADQQEGELIAPVDKKEVLSENILPIQKLAGEVTDLQSTPNATTTISPDTQEKPNNSVRLQEAPVAGKTVTSEDVVVPPTSAEAANESVTSEHVVAPPTSAEAANETVTSKRVVAPPTSAKVDGSSNPTINVKENLSQVSEKRVDHIFYCRYCYYVISDVADYKSHMAKKHADKYCSGVVHYCPKCRFVTDLPQNYKHHMARHNVHELLKCDVCYYLAPSQMSLRKHFQSFCCPAAKIAADSKIVVVRNVRSKSQLNVTESQSDGGRASGSEGLGCHKETVGKSSDTLKAEKPDIIDDSRGVAPATINNFAEPETDDDYGGGCDRERRDVDVDSGEVCEDTSAELPSGLEDVSSSSKTDSLQTALVDSDSKPSEAPAQGGYQKVNDEQVSKALIDATRAPTHNLKVAS